MRNSYSLVILLLGLSVGFSQSAGKTLEFTGRVMRVQDGDAFYVTHSGKVKPVRLNGVDCPEVGQPFGTRAKKVLSDRVLKKNVRVVAYTTDERGRMIADVFVDDDQPVSRDLIRFGHCRPTQSHAPDRNGNEEDSETEVTDD